MEDYGRSDLFRYGIISPLLQRFLSGDKITLEDFKELAKKEYYYKGKSYKFSPYTIKKWYYHYQKEGLNKLKTKERKDKNGSRKLSDEVIEYIIDLRSKYPKMTTKNMYERILKDGYINKSISIRSFYRYLSSNDLKRSVVNRKERRRYEREYPNDVWQGDTTYGPYITMDGKKYRTYLIHFIDDNSRLVVGHGFYLNDNAINVQKTLNKAIKTYGLPKQIYLDNGKSYKNCQLSLICARLGIKLTHTHPYDPESKGKVERCFKTIKEGWMNSRNWNTFKSIEDLEKDYEEYLFNDYINKEHRELGDTPNNVWHKGIENVKWRRLEEEKVEDAFMHEIKRKVSKDGVISINNELYEVDSIYRGEDVNIRYYINNLDKMWIYEKDERKSEVRKLNKKENSKVKRENKIDYSKIVNNEEDVIELGDSDDVS